MPRIIKGSKQEIVEAISQLKGEVSEAIVFFKDPADAGGSVFTEMAPFQADAPYVDDSRGSAYGREGE